MAEESKKVVLPPFLLRRLEAFRVVKGDETTYIVRDKVQNKSYDFDAWQYFILEVLHGYDNFPKLQSAFKDRFDRVITEDELKRFLSQVADQKLLSEAAETHPLLAPYTRKTYEVTEGKATPKSFEAAVNQAIAPVSQATPPARSFETTVTQAMRAVEVGLGNFVPVSQVSSASAAMPASATASAAMPASATASAAMPASATASAAMPAGATATAAMPAAATATVSAAGPAAAAAQALKVAPDAAKPKAVTPGADPKPPEELPAGVQDALGLDWRTTKTFVGLFDPRWLLNLLMPVLRPMRHLRFVVPVLVLAALFVIFSYPHVVLEDLRKFKPDINLLEHLIFVFLTVHVVTTLTAAAVARRLQGVGRQARRHASSSASCRGGPQDDRRGSPSRGGRRCGCTVRR